jgi:hypothetical protein
MRRKRRQQRHQRQQAAAAMPSKTEGLRCPAFVLLCVY